MNTNNELQDLQKQKQVQKLDNRKLTFEEYNQFINERMKHINSELSLLFYELAQGATQQKIDSINNVLRDFQLNQLQDLQEQLKKVYY